MGEIINLTKVIIISTAVRVFGNSFQVIPAFIQIS